MRIVLGYVRASSEEQAEHGLGLEAQRQLVRVYCEMKVLHLVTIFEDPAVSGGKPLGSRPAGSRLLAEARRTKPVIVVAKLDRLFRSVADAAQRGGSLKEFIASEPTERAPAELCRRVGRQRLFCRCQPVG